MAANERRSVRRPARRDVSASRAASADPSASGFAARVGARTTANINAAGANRAPAGGYAPSKVRSSVSGNGAGMGMDSAARPAVRPVAGTGAGAGAGVSAGAASASAATAGDRRACATESRAPRRRVAKKRRIWLRVTLSLVAAFVLVVAAAFSWQRWLRFDDAQDFQGAWYAADTLSESGVAQETDAAHAVSISADAIQLTDDVAYSYHLDSWSKTLSFSFGKYVGSGSYQFSLDRRILVIKDGSYSWFSTLGDDAVWMFQNLLAAIQGGQPPLPSGGNVIVLVRE